MIQGSTPVLTIRLKGRALNGAQAIMITLRKDGINHNFDQSRITVASEGSDALAMVHLTQAETLALKPGRVGVQLRWVDWYGEAHTTKPATLANWEAYYKAVMA